MLRTPRRADSFYTYKHLVELRSHTPSQAGGKIPHLCSSQPERHVNDEWKGLSR